MPTDACQVMTKKAQHWVALVTIGGCLLLFIIILAIIGLSFGVPEVAALLLTIHYNGTLYFIVIAGVILITMALLQRQYKKAIC